MKKKKRAAVKRVSHRRSWKIPVLLAGLGVVCVIAVYLALRPAKIELPYLTAGYVAVMDAETGKLVYEKQADQPRSPASLTKLMTLFVVLDEIENGGLEWQDTWQVTAEEAYTPGSKYGMQPGEVFTVEQLVAGTILCSGCDCVQCLVNLTTGNEEDFVQRMNEKAEQLGLKGTHYVNATGIDASGHYMTPKDVAKLARALLESHPELLDFTAQPTVTIGEREFENMHRLVGWDDRVLGLKTGTTTIGGYNLVTYAKEDDRAYIIVLMDSNSDSTRFSETETVVNVLFEEG